MVDSSLDLVGFERVVEEVVARCIQLVVDCFSLALPALYL